MPAVRPCALLLLGTLASAHSLLRSHHAQRKELHLVRHADEAGGVKDIYPFYHTSDELQSELSRLAGSCSGFSFETKSQSTSESKADVDIVTMKKPGSSPKNKMYFLFGEHARELISPESGIYFLKSLCGETETSDYLQGVLDDTEFRVVLNGNPHSRRKVEGGDFCLRVNENGVDLNRNWDEKWEQSPELSPQDTDPGPKPFSEPETQIFREDVTAYMPTSFVTIHSGTYGMYMPWAYDMEHLAQRNNKAMMNMLKDLDSEYCQCPFGAAGKEVGYSCPGTCLDYVYDQLNASYAFAFEIYTGPEYADDLKERFQEKIQELNAEQGPAKVSDSLALPDLKHEDYNDIFNVRPSDFVQLSSHAQHKLHRDGRDCFGQFNPDNQEAFQRNIDNWARVYGDLARKIAADIH